MMILRITDETQANAATPLAVLSFFPSVRCNMSFFVVRLTFSIMQLTIADVDTTKTYNFEAN